MCSKIVKSGDQLVQGTQEMERKQSLKEMRGYTEARKSWNRQLPTAPPASSWEPCLFTVKRLLHAASKKRNVEKAEDKVCFSKIERCAVTT